MSKSQVFFFATIEDLESILISFEKKFLVKYVETGLFSSDAITQYDSSSDIPDLGKVNAGDWNLCKSLLIMPKDINVQIRTIPQKNGGMKYAIDQSINPKTIAFKAGGIYMNGCLIAGVVGTISDDPISESFYKSLSKNIKSKFNKIGSFYVGKKAESLLDEGWRLVTNDKSPVEYDLKK